MNDGIIDLTEYLRRKEEEYEDEPRSTFALYGADGERARFALPLWRTIYLAGGDRGGIVWQEGEGGTLHSLVVLDLAEDPPRTVFRDDRVEGMADEAAPVFRDDGRGGVEVFLGDESGRRWFLVITGTESREGDIATQDREDILFLAGECAGLLFLRGFAATADRDPEG